MKKVVSDTSCDCDIPAKQQLIFFLEPIDDSTKNELREYLYEHQRLHLFKYEVLDLKGAQKIISGVGNRKLECNECSPSDTTTDTLGFELVVKYFQFGNAICVCHSPLFLNDGADDEMVLECIFKEHRAGKRMAQCQAWTDYIYRSWRWMKSSSSVTVPNYRLLLF